MAGPEPAGAAGLVSLGRPMKSAQPQRSSPLAGLLIAAVGLTVILACAFYLSVRHVVWPRLDGWRTELFAQLQKGLDRPVSAERLRPGWEGRHPTLAIDGLRLDGPDGEPRLEVGSAYLRLGWRSILSGRPRLAAVRLEAPVLVVERLGQGRHAVAGLETVVGHGAERSGDAGLGWLLGLGELAVEGAAVRFVDRTGSVPEQRIEGIDLAIVNIGRQHQARIVVPQPGGGSLSGVVDFLRPPLSRPTDWRQWRGELHLAAVGIDPARLEALAGLLELHRPSALPVVSGRVDLLAWSRFDGGRLDDATVRVRADAVGATLPAGRLALREVASELRLTRRPDGGGTIDAGALSVVDARGFRLATDGPAWLQLDAAGLPVAAGLRLAPFDAGAALAAARRLPLSADAQRSLQPVELAAGRVRDLTLRWQDPSLSAADRPPAGSGRSGSGSDAAQPRVEVTAAFDRLGLRVRGGNGAGPQPPGFRNLAGTLRVTERGGAVTLSGRAAQLSVPGVFAEPDLPMDRLEAEASWSIDPARGEQWLRVDVPRLHFANADTRGLVAGSWRSGGTGPALGLIEMAGRLERVEASRVARYLPVVLPEHVRNWVRDAVTGGTVEEVLFELAGDLWNFPFRDPAEGRFRLSGTVRDGRLAFAPQWPTIDRIGGELVFERAGLEIRGRSGQVSGVRLSDIQARIADFHDALLTIEGQGEGRARDLLRFIDDSPLAATVSTFTRDIRVEGDARLGLRLALPLDDLSRTRVAGTVFLPGNDVDLDRTLPPFERVVGRLEFTESGLALPELRGIFLGGPVRVQGRPAAGGRMRIEAAGSIDAAGMRRVVDNPLTRRLSGRTDYRARIEVDGRSSTLQIESDLVGLASALPAPFDKPARAAWPLRVSGTPLAPPVPGARPPGDRLEVRLRDSIALALERERDPASERLRVVRTGFAVDAEPALRDTGLTVLLHTDQFDVDAWLSVLGNGEPQQAAAGAVPQGTGLPLMPDLVSVVADRVRVGGHDLNEVVFGATRLAGHWRANVAAREVQGHFDWLDARPGEQIGTLVARFDRLELPRSREGELESALSAPPTRLPALDVSAEDLVLGGVSLGRLSLKATNSGGAGQPVWQLDRLVLANPAARLEASGTWSLAGAAADGAGGGPPAAAAAAAVAAAGRSTALDFRLELRDAGALLTRFGLPDVVRGGTGSLGGRIHWRGTPLAIDYPSLDGGLRIELGQGAFLKVEPGPAKLIGVLNMQSLPRRLAGDFRDLFGDGFAFDSIAGEVQIDDGIARTTELRMRGVQAQVRIRGEADLLRETQRLNVEVLPEFNAGLASLAVGAMVNPVIGLGSLAAQYVLRKPLQQALAYEVDVTGSWSDPAVRERSRRVEPAPQPPAGVAP